MIKFSKNEMMKAAKSLQKNIKDGKGYLSKISMQDMGAKKHEISKAYYMGLFEAQNVFIRNHGRLPNFVTLNSIAHNPLVIDYQDSSTTCGPTSLSMAIQMLFGWESESKCKKACKTGSFGTSPDNLIAGAKSLGYKLSKISRNSSNVKASILLGKPVIAHIQTRPATCLGYTGDYGHYILIYGYTSDGKYKVADPTKGLKTCAFSVLDKATNGRSIHYYSVSPL